LVQCIALFLINGSSGQFLQVQGRTLSFNGQHVFLSGVNIAWNSYSFDFGNGQYASSGPILEQYIRDIRAAGGNSLRIWVHIEGENTPEFNADGFVIAPDRTGDLLNDLSRFLDVAAENDVFVIPVLWNGALMRNQRYVDLYYDDAKLNSYIQNVLQPLVAGLAGKHALAAWEVINEPEGSVLIQANANPCYDTTILANSGAGWTGVGVPMQRFLRFINIQNSAIRAADPKALITAGAWSELSQTSAFSNSFNYYSDECLRSAGGAQNGIIDFYQIHTYTWQGIFAATSPFRLNADQFLHNKPLVIGEWSVDCHESNSAAAAWQYLYNNHYAGSWSWQYNEGGDCSDNRVIHNQGMASISTSTHNGFIRVNIP